MIIENTVVRAESNVGSVACKIEANSVMFDLLSSRLYSNKPLAVVRELSTNALDAQIEARMEHIPFEVHLPTRLEPFFSIRDFGVGMSEETVFELYSTMGSSSKRGSNAFNGALGVGSKSPFAYTQGGAFTLTSFQYGTKSIYSVFSDAGVPSIAKLGEFKTDEPNGVEVSVPIQVQDINDFYRSAVNVYSHFRVKPKCNQDLEYPDFTKPIFQGKNWKIFEESTNPVVVMANVAYPIDCSTYSLPNLEIQGLVVSAETGEVQMSGSREGLSYTKETLTNLKKFETEITKELTAQYLEMTKNIKGNLIQIVNTIGKMPYSVRSIFSNSGNHPIGIKYQGSYPKIGLDGYQLKYTSWRRGLRKDTYAATSLLSGIIIFADNQQLTNKVLGLYKERDLGKIVAIQPEIAGKNKIEKEEQIKFIQEFAENCGVTIELASTLAKKHGLAIDKSNGTTGVYTPITGATYYHKTGVFTLNDNIQVNGDTKTKYQNCGGYKQFSTSRILNTVKTVLAVDKSNSTAGVFTLNDNIQVNGDTKTKIIYIPKYGTGDYNLANRNFDGYEQFSTSRILNTIKTVLDQVKYDKDLIIIIVSKTQKSFTKFGEHYEDFLKREIGTVTMVGDALLKKYQHEYRSRLVDLVNMNLPKDYINAVKSLLESGEQLTRTPYLDQGNIEKNLPFLKVVKKEFKDPKIEEVMKKYDMLSCVNSTHKSQVESIAKMIDSCYNTKTKQGV
jgi:hypothetical protein